MQPAVTARSGAGTASDAHEVLLVSARALDALLEEAGAGARQQVEDVLGRARRARHAEATAWALRALAVVHRHEDDLVAAGRLLDEALRVTRAAGLPHVEAWVLASRASVELSRGRTARVRADAEAGLALVADAPADDPAVTDVRSRLYMVLAVADHNAGRLGAVESRYRDLLRQAAPGSAHAVRGANNLALVLAARGAFDEALAWAHRAVEGAARTSPALQPWPFLTRALIEVRTGRLADGLRDLERAARSCEDAGLSPGEYYLEYADTMRELRLLPEALQAGERAVEVLERAGAGLVEAEARVALAETLLMAGDLAAAAAAADRARALARRQRRQVIHDRAVVAAVQARWRGGRSEPGDLASVRRAARRLRDSGQLAAAVDAHLVAGRLAASRGDRRAVRDLATAAELARGGSLTVRVRGRVAAAWAAGLRGDDDEVVAVCRAGLRDLAGHRESLPTMELRALASGHGAELGELGLGVVLRRGSPAAVLRWMEQTRAAALLTRPTPQAAGPTTAGPGGEAGGERAAGPAAGPDEAAPEEPTGARATRSVIVADDERAADARRSAWLEQVSAPVGPPRHQAPSLRRLRESLDGRVLVEYGRLHGRVVAVVVDQRRARTVDLGDVEEEVAGTLRALVFALRRLVDPRSPAAADAARTSADLRLSVLRRALVAPLGLPADAELVVVPVGLLHGVPWSALHDGPVGLAPSATAWVRTCARSTGTGGATVLVAGPGLTGAQEEVDALAGLHPGAVVLGPPDGDAARVVDAIADADLAHLACHGALRADNPMFSSVVLADGPVTVQELHRAGVAPRRLVLASCHSGADVAYEGDEVLGLVAAALAQGTGGVVASIAAVPDVEVVDLMVALHRGLATGETMVRALHRARRQVDRSTPAGYVNWCTFGAHGAA